MAATDQGQAKGKPKPKPQPAARPRESTYTVQVRTGTGDNPHWEDVAEVTVPARSKRRTIIARGLKEAGLIENGQELDTRVLDSASAHVTKVRVKQPDPTLELD